MSVQATLVYTIVAIPPVSQAQLEAAVSAVPLDTDAIIRQTGCVLDSDTTAPLGLDGVTRTLVFGLPPAFQANFPASAGNQAMPFNNLYTHAIGGATGSVVVANPIVIA